MKKVIHDFHRKYNECNRSYRYCIGVFTASTAVSDAAASYLEKLSVTFFVKEYMLELRPSNISDILLDYSHCRFMKTHKSLLRKLSIKFLAEL